jgi:membrane protein
MTNRHDDIHGRGAHWPSQIPRLGWRDIAWRLYGRINEDRVMLVAAGATFYLLLALFPALAAFVSLYGLIADPATIAGHLDALRGIMPEGGLDLIGGQLNEFARQSPDSMGISFLIAFAIAFWSANNGIKTLFEALNIAYREREKRSFIRLNLLAFTFTLATMVVAATLIALIGILPALLALLPVDETTDLVLRYARWPVLLVIAALGIAILYRFGPSRARARWRWVSWGGLLACTVWLATSAGFSIYLQGFADYNATYGSLGAAIGFMMWTWISVIVLLLGAQLNAEIEHQTGVDTTTGKEMPMGMRGATMADTLGEAAGDEASDSPER